MKIKTNIKSGGWKGENHNQTVRVKSGLKAGGNDGWINHNQTLHLKSAVKAGGVAMPERRDPK